jgi:hypothetical protein
MIKSEILYTVHADLWGYSEAWREAFYRAATENGLAAHWSCCPANHSVWGRSLGRRHPGPRVAPLAQPHQSHEGDMMRISHEGDQVLVGDLKVEPGVARALATLYESKARLHFGAGPIEIDAGATKIKFEDRAQVTKMAGALRRHAGLAEVVRGPVTKGPIRDGRDAIQRRADVFGTLADLITGSRREN